MSIEREQIVKLTNEMIQIRSVMGDYEESSRVLDLVDSYLSEEIKSGILIKRRYENEGIVSQIWGDKNTLMEPKLLLSGHIDVVNADADSQFTPVEKDGRIYGRGAGDMKGPDAAMVIAFKEWINKNNSNGVSLVLTSDEEKGGFKGTEYLIKNKHLKPSVVFIPDGEKGTNFSITDSQKAPHHFRVVVNRKGGHASKAFEIENPIDILVAAYLDVQKEFNKANKINDWESSLIMTSIQSPVIDVFNPITGANMKTMKEMDKFDYDKLVKLPEGKRLIMDLVNAKFGRANKIQSSAEAWFSWRWPLEKKGFREGMREIRKIFRQHGCSFPTPKDEHGQGAGCVLTNEEKASPFVQNWKEIIEKSLGHEIGYVKMHGATDGRFFQTAGSHVLVTSVNGDNYHGLDEWVDIQSLVTLSEAVVKYQEAMTK